eukprot:gb/GECG01016577.1/.p1 GENE.gb/GECG01016577.1/~~gb/GECG01016577.1/.p1  ORF type:complete len:239 (+),score=58.06 gb/GECG01016577.1/:1-717(+)
MKGHSSGGGSGKQLPWLLAGVVGTIASLLLAYQVYSMTENATDRLTQNIHMLSGNIQELRDTLGRMEKQHQQDSQRMEDSHKEVLNKISAQTDFIKKVDEALQRFRTQDSQGGGKFQQFSNTLEEVQSELSDSTAKILNRFSDVEKQAAANRDEIAKVYKKLEEIDSIDLDEGDDEKEGDLDKEKEQNMEGVEGQQQDHISTQNYQENRNERTQYSENQDRNAESRYSIGRLRGEARQ